MAYTSESRANDPNSTSPNSNDQRLEVLKNLYKPLQPGETRLLSLKPGEFNDPLEVYLRIAVFIEGVGWVEEQRLVEYEALSYCWGETILSHPLKCNGFPISITQNLSRALRHLRLRTHIRYLWVDAVCIDQSNNEEKSIQIRNLRDIFRQAKQVIAWLGEETEHTDFSVQLLKSYQTSLAVDVDEAVSSLDKFSTMYKNESFGKIFEGLRDLAQRPWTSRAWVIQEVFAAQTIIVQCGRHLIEWDLFSRLDTVFKLLEKIWKSSHQLDDESNRSSDNTGKTHGHESIMTPIKFLASIRRSDFNDAKSQLPRGTFPGASPEPAFGQSTNGADSLYRLLQETSHVKVTDPRDRIWALIGLTQVPVFYGRGDRDVERAICIDYEKPVAQVYSEVTKYFLSSFGASYYLLFFGTQKVDSQLENENLPSWCLDFRNIQLPDYEMLVHLPQRGKATIRALGPQSSSWNTLTFTGWHMGTICAVKEQSNEVPSLSEYHQNSIAYQDIQKRRTVEYLQAIQKAASARTVNVEVRNTPYMKRWLLDCTGPRLRWDEASSEIARMYHRDHLSYGDIARERFSRLLNRDKPYHEKRYVSQDIMSDYVGKNRDWLVVGEPKVDDMIVQFRSCIFTVVLRRISASEYIFIGRADTVNYITLSRDRFESRVPNWSLDLGFDNLRHANLGFNTQLFDSEARNGELLDGEQIFDVH